MQMGSKKVDTMAQAEGNHLASPTNPPRTLIVSIGRNNNIVSIERRTTNGPHINRIHPNPMKQIGSSHPRCAHHAKNATPVADTISTRSVPP